MTKLDTPKSGYREKTGVKVGVGRGNTTDDPSGGDLEASLQSYKSLSGNLNNIE